MNVFNIFPNPIFLENCPLQESVEEEIKKELMEEDGNLIPNESSNKLFHLDNKLKKSFLNKKKFEMFNRWLIKCCNYYITEVIGYELVDGTIITDSWLNVCNEGGFQVPHYHTNSYISGTYYVNIDEDHAPLTFRHIDNSTHSPNQSLSLGVGNRNPTLYNSDAVFLPQKGQLFLWQSHLTHGYFNNNKDGRISISMNFLPKVVSNYRYAFEIKPHE